LVNRIVLLFLPRFFIGYWILKTGLDFHPGPFLFYSLPGMIKAPLVAELRSMKKK